MITVHRCTFPILSVSYASWPSFYFTGRTDGQQISIGLIQFLPKVEGLAFILHRKPGIQKLFDHSFTNAMHIVDGCSTYDIKSCNSKSPRQAQDTLHIIVLCDENTYRKVIQNWSVFFFFCDLVTIPKLTIGGEYILSQITSSNVSNL